jgi:hypothetical protein
LVSGFGLGRSGRGRVEAKEDRLGDRRGCGTLGLDRWLVGGWQVNPAADAGGDQILRCGGVRGRKPLRGGLNAVGGFQGLDPVGDLMGGR